MLYTILTLEWCLNGSRRAVADVFFTWLYARGWWAFIGARVPGCMGREGGEDVAATAAFIYGMAGVFCGWIMLYNNYLVYLQRNYNESRAMAKVIHVHLIGKRRDLYFGSISAVFEALSPEEVGMTKSSLLHAGLSGGGTVVTKRALIKQGELITCHRRDIKGDGE